jgi:hypothetical protein
VSKVELELSRELAAHGNLPESDPLS